MKKILLLTLLVCQSVAIMAADNWVKVGNLWYWYNDAKTTAAVVPARNSETYTGLSDEITIPATIHVDETDIDVTEIRANTFQGCTNITSVVINAAITQILSNCFKGCSGLISINIPATVTKINSSAFQNCSSLDVVNIPDGVTTIYGSAFAGCSGMTEINIPASVTSIEGNAFDGCTSLTKANFASYESLCSIDFNNVKSNPLNNKDAELWIGGTKQTSLMIPASITTIKQYAFAGLNSVSSVDFSAVDGGLTIAKDAFVNNSGYDIVIFKNAAQLCSMDYATLSSNPLYYGHHIYYFGNANEQKRIEIPAGSLKDGHTIRKYCFAGASAITRVNIPEEATWIDDGAFVECTNLELVSFVSEPHFQSIGWGVETANPFANGKANPLIVDTPLENIELSEDVPAYKYKNSKWLKSVTLTTGVTSIGEEAFMGCTNLTSVTFSGAEITSIGSRAFRSCWSLGNITLPESVTSIGEEAFRDCKSTSFTEITIPANCISLGQGAFVWCTQLKTVTIKSPIDIPNLCFQNCGNLDSVITTTTKNIGNDAFYKCTKLKTVPMTDGLVEIGDNAFFDCGSLTDLTLDEAVNLTTIGEAAFKGDTCVTMVSLPEAIEHIKDNAFQDCKRFVNLYCHRTTSVPTIHYNTFGGRGKSITLHVTNPTDYLAEVNWKKLNIVSWADVTLSFYVNGERLEKKITLKAGSRITTPNPEDSIKTHLYKDDDIEEEFSGWDKPFPKMMPSEDTRFDGYVTTTAMIDHFKYSLRPAQTIEKKNYENRAVLLGAEKDYITQSNHKVIVPETVTNTNTNGTYNKTPYPVIAIADTAFVNQKELTDVKLTANITELGVGAFKGCSKLESINLSESNVTSLSENVFQNCTALSFTEIPNKITSIGKWALSNTYCSAVTIPSSIAKMGDEVFKDCKSLKKVTFAEGFALALPQMTFLSCGALEDITLVGTMGSIGIRAFEGCGSITNLVIPEGIARIGKQAFNGCNKLANVTLPSTITQINEQAFMGCDNLVQIVVKATNVPATNSDAFTDYAYQHAYVYVADIAKYSAAEPWNTFTLLFANTTYKLTYFVDGKKYDEKDINVGEKIIPIAKPTKDGHQFSDDWEGLPEVMPAENVEVTGKFEYQLSYTLADGSLTPEKDLPDPKLYWYGEKYKLSEGLIWPSHRCFWKINDEEEWKTYEEGLPEGTTMPGNDVVIKIMYKLSEKDEINGSLKYRVYLLDNKAEVIANLDDDSKQIPTGDIEIPSSISVKISESPEEYKEFPVTAIQDNAFGGNQAITGMILHEGIVSIGQRAFSDNRFTTFNVPASVTSIDIEAFRYCRKMETITFADGSPIKTFPVGTFQDCSALQSIILPAQLDSIKESGFSGCTQLEIVTLPSTLSFLGARAFGGCTALKQITMNASEAPTTANSSNLFSDEVYTTAKLYLPEGNSGYDKAPWISFTKGELKEYTLTYQWDDKEAKTKQISVGAKVDLPKPEDKVNEFSGWKDLPEIMPAQDVEVTGKFKYQLSYVLAEGSETPTNDLPEAEELWYGDNIVLPASLEWAGHLCTTTYKDGDVPETMPASDVVIKVNYQQSEQETTIDNINYKVVLLKVNSVEPHAEVIASLSKTGNVDIPASITYNTKTYPVTIINDNAFNSNNSRSITGVTLHSGLEKIGARAFRDCRFTELTIPATVKNIGNEAFLYCTTLQKVSFGADIELKKLPNGAFQSCSSLASIELPEGLDSIGVSAFAGCSSLETVKLPSTIKGINDYAFSGSTGIETVTATSTNLPTATSTIFDDKVYDNALLKVLTGTTHDDDPWKLFDKVQEGEDGGSGTDKCEMPTISYDKGTLKFECATEGATIVSDIKDVDITKDTNASPSTKALTKKYTITAYAKKSGMLWSDEVTATITWRNGKPEFSDNITVVNYDDPVFKVGDVDENGEVNLSDARKVVRIFVGKE